MNSFTIETPPDHLDLDYCLRSGQVFRWQKLHDGSWLGVDGQTWYQIKEVANGRLEVSSNGTEQTFKSFFRLDWNADEVVGAILEKGPELAPYIGQLRGLRIMRPSDPVEAFFCFLCTANNNLSRIVPMCQALGRYGDRIDETEGIALHAFPSVETIAQIPEMDLRAKGFGYRGATIPAIAQQVLGRGQNWFSEVREAGYEEAHKELLTIKGIGPKLADCICLFAFDMTESVPLDTHIWQAFTRLYFPDWKGLAVTEKRYREATEAFRKRFGKLAGWAHQYLFYDNVLNWRERQKSERAAPV